MLQMKGWRHPEADLLKAKQQVGNQVGCDPRLSDLEPMNIAQFCYIHFTLFRISHDLCLYS